jgi:hypothetical protein
MTPSDPSAGEKAARTRRRRTAARKAMVTRKRRDPYQGPRGRSRHKEALRAYARSTGGA